MSKGSDEAIGGKGSARPDLGPYLGQRVRVIVDRPLGSCHPAHPDIRYPLNYGYLPGTVAGDGEPIDAYRLGPDRPVAEATGIAIAVVRRADDAEDKLVVATDGRLRTAAEIGALVAFQERFFASRIEALPQVSGDEAGDEAGDDG